MAAEIWASFARLQTAKDAMLLEVSAWSQPRLTYRPEPAAWSVVEVFDHLVKVERACLTAVRVSLPDGHAVTLKDRLGALMVNSVMRSPIRIKVPAGAGAVRPEAACNLPDVTREWEQARTELAGLLKELQPEQLRIGVLKHPVAGWMTMPQMLGFLESHLIHHRYQLKRLHRASVDM